jgi:hypothetical protein
MGIRLLFDEIDKRYANPEEAFLAKIDISAKSGYQMPTIVSLLKNGPVSISDKDVQNKTVPEQATRAFTLYKLLHARHPDYLSNLEIGNEKTMQTYEAARILQSTGNTSSDADSMIQASVIVNSPKPVRASDVAELERKFRLATGAKSTGSFRSENFINQYMTLMLRSGVGIDAAATKSTEYAKMNGVMVNGSYVLTNDINLSSEAKSSYEMISNVIASDYSKKYGTNAEELHLERGPYGYQLFSNIGLPVPGSPYYSADQINKMVANQNEMNRAKENQRAVEEATMEPVNRQQNNRTFNRSFGRNVL